MVVHALAEHTRVSYLLPPGPLEGVSSPAVQQSAGQGEGVLPTVSEWGEHHLEMGGRCYMVYNMTLICRYASYYESLLRNQYNQLYQKNQVLSYYHYIQERIRTGD